MAEQLGFSLFKGRPGYFQIHISGIIRQVEQQYEIKLGRESMVSTLTKKVKIGVMFVRTGPNIFGLKGQ